MGVEFIDKTGQPMSEEELKEALKAVENVIVRDIMKIPPELSVQLTTIRHALLELLHIKKVIREHKERNPI